jgi:hypothetical protein
MVLEFHSEEQRSRPRESVLADYDDEDELCAQLGICKKTLNRWLAAGTGPPCTVIGRKKRFRRASTAKWILDKERRQEKTSRRR